MSRSYGEDFFSEANAITVEDTPFSQLELSDEVREEPTVAVRFDSDGMAYEEEVSEDDEQRQTSFLEPMRLPLKQGITEAGSCFAEVMARVQEMQNTSKLTAIRYEARGVGLKVSSLPSGIDFICDVCVVARKAMSPALHRLFIEIYFEGYGENACSIPEKLQVAIQRKCALAWKKAGIHPWGLYWAKRVNLETIKEVTLIDLDEKENRKEKLKAARNARRRTARKARPVISVYKAAA